MFRGFWRAVYILPVVIPPIIVATVWRNMFDAGQRGDQPRPPGPRRQLLNFPPDTWQIDWLRQVDDPIRFIPSFRWRTSRCLSRTRGWAGRSTRWSPPARCRASPASSTRPRRWMAGSLAEVPQRHDPVPAPGDAPVRDLRLRHHVQPLLPVVLHAGGRAVRRTELLVTQAFRLVTEQRLFGVAAAFAVIMFFILLVLTLLTNKVAKATRELRGLRRRR